MLYVNRPAYRADAPTFTPPATMRRELGSHRAPRLQQSFARSILLHGTSPIRQGAARLIAKLVSEAGAVAGAFGRTSATVPARLIPHVRVETRGPIEWTKSLSMGVLAIEGAHPIDTWELWLLRPTHYQRSGPLLSYVDGWLRAAIVWDPTPTPRHTDIYSRMAHALERLLDFDFNLPSAACDSLSMALCRMAVPSTDVRRASRDVASALLSPQDLLGPALLDLSHAIASVGGWGSTASVCRVAYESAITFHDPHLAISAATSRARALVWSGDTPGAMRWFTIAKSLSELESTFGRLATVLNDIAEILDARGDVALASRVRADAYRIERSGALGPDGDQA